ncbi:MAG TPA: helicase C-terminal domain-containing protein [Humisphaera sp.]|jgi:Rad3-related DNA helicase/REP element-mobilizing transposase RayT|nr:helicase C-terminal domain-containing protein [Humisphaera sp.]
MPTCANDILGRNGAIARRLGDRYEFRPQQLEMASAVEDALNTGNHLMVEAGTGVGKSFAYLLPAIDFAVKQKKRVVISTHTISLQEQLIEKDIPLLQAVYPDEFTAVLIKGRSNYLCKRRLEQTRGRQGMLFEQQKQLESLWTIEEWAGRTTDGSLADLPSLPDPSVWDKVCAEHGNCLGKKCRFYEDCFWQSAKRRMYSGTLLVTNHALFFSDLALRAAGVNYLPKYDAVILDEAHTVEDVAGSHFGLSVSEYGVRYQLRALFDIRRGKGMLSTHGAKANDAIQDVVDLHDLSDEFFESCLQWQDQSGRTNGRIQQANFVENTLSPKLRALSLHLKAMLVGMEDEEEMSEISSHAEKAGNLAQTLEAIIGHGLPEAVYWMDKSGTAQQRKISLHAAPVNIAAGLKMHLFEKVRSVVMTSATLCTGKGGEKTKVASPVAMPQRGTGFQPVQAASSNGNINIREGAYLPHWTRNGSIYSITFRLVDSLPAHVLEEWKAERQRIHDLAKQQSRPLTGEETRHLEKLYSTKVERFLDAGHGSCWLRNEAIAKLVAQSLAHFDKQRYQLLAWCIMPNHVHVVVQPCEGVHLSGILHSWKRHSAREANLLLHRTGDFWQAESYDHLIRDRDEFFHAVDYLWKNPESAGLVNWKWRGRDEQRIAEIVDGSSEGRRSHGLKTRATMEQPGAPLPVSASPSQNASGFDYFRTRLGVPDCRTLQLGSPFDYSTQATLYLETQLPEPTDTRLFLPAACEKILHYLKQTEGGAFVLFTSYKMLIEAANRLKEQLDELGYPILVQGQGAPRKVLLERFRNTENAVLFGTGSFWQGIDVQGDKLRNVIIVKLPFAVPDEPIIEARLDTIKQNGGNPFMDYSVPEAIIKLKQGFGRLIRSKTDSGIVVILDSRVKSKRYGKLFLDALPECRRGVASE